MHLVIAAWLFVIFTMSLTMRSAIAGIALFVAAGVVPVALYLMLAIRRARARHPQPSVGDVSARGSREPRR